MVARAAPFTPILRAKMNTGSKVILQIAPISTETMETFVKPWAVIKAFMPRVSWTNRVPKA